jgi:hypothetical protein
LPEGKKSYPIRLPQLKEQPLNRKESSEIWSMKALYFFLLYPDFTKRIA